MVIFQILLLNDKRVISQERNTVRASNPHASLTWTDNTSNVGYGIILVSHFICALEDLFVIHKNRCHRKYHRFVQQYKGFEYYILKTRIKQGSFSTILCVKLACHMICRLLVRPRPTTFKQVAQRAMIAHLSPMCQCQIKC